MTDGRETWFALASALLLPVLSVRAAEDNPIHGDIKKLADEMDVRLEADV